MIIHTREYSTLIHMEERKDLVWNHAYPWSLTTLTHSHAVKVRTIPGSPSPLCINVEYSMEKAEGEPGYETSSFAAISQ